MVGLVVLRMTAPSIRAARAELLDQRLGVLRGRLGAGQLGRPRRAAPPSSGVSRTGHSWAPIRATAAVSSVTALSSVDHRAVAGAAAGGQPHPGHALLGGLDEVDPLPADGRAEAADLADRLGAALELLAVLLDDDLRRPCGRRPPRRR